MPAQPRTQRVLCCLAVLQGLACRPAVEPSFLVVSLDTFRGDRLGMLDADGRSLTPSLDALASQSLVFPKTYAQANETLYSHAALFTGMYARDLGPLRYERFRLPPDAPTLAACMLQGGYNTQAVVGGGHLSAHFGLGSGFGRYEVALDFSSLQETVPIALRELESLADRGEPFLLFVHGYDAHSPYIKAGPLFGMGAPGYGGPMAQLARNPLTYERILGDRYYPEFSPTQVQDGLGHAFISPDSFDELEAWAAAHPDSGTRMSQDDIAFLLGSYDGAVRHADAFVGILLDGLEALGLEDEVVVVVLGDHGEDLLEHGHFNHRLSLHDENVHVPLMLRVPGVEPAVDPRPVGLVDVMPTILELGRLRSRPGRGQSLLGEPDGRMIYSESGRGEVAIRDATGALSVPLAVIEGPEPPAERPAGAWFTDAEGRERGWDPGLVSAHWRALEERVR
jgi:arylsulfatase A-like enzyme